MRFQILPEDSPKRVISEGPVFLPSGFFGAMCSISGRVIGSEAEKGGVSPLVPARLLLLSGLDPDWVFSLP
jgi:hypothetical protein